MSLGASNRNLLNLNLNQKPKERIKMKDKTPKPIIEEIYDRHTDKKPQPLIVTTAHRGVFFGYGTPTDAATITLTNARMCVYWTCDLHGVFGLASRGPGAGCRIGPSVERITLRDVTAVIECSESAATEWGKEIWS
jgi:hypothetical protein